MTQKITNKTFLKSTSIEDNNTHKIIIKRLFNILICYNILTIIYMK